MAQLLTAASQVGQRLVLLPIVELSFLKPRQFVINDRAHREVAVPS